MATQLRRKIVMGGVTLTLGALAACGPKSTPAPPPAPPPPPPPVVVVIPPRPIPPMGAAAGLYVPLVGEDGVRQTVNARISTAQTVWNLRSAYNVAALNCLKPEHAEILGGYKAFLKSQKKGLAKANTTVDAEFKKKYGTSYIRPREAYMTQVYNYYAYPPTLQNFCDAALVMARESVNVKAAELNTFSGRNLVMLDSVFENFYRSYEQYARDLALWKSKYEPAPAPAATAVAAPGK